jgi:hypothetical protein
MKQEITIQSTTDYSLFKPHGEQQPMSPPHMKRMISSMKQNGFIKAKPIHCYRDGKFLRVIDGHHRVRAAQILGISIYYIVGSSDEADLIAPENWAVRKWGTEAFVNMYAARGIKDYITLASYIKRGLPVAYSISLLYGETTAASNQNNAIRTGSFRIKTTKTANEVLAIMDSLAAVTDVAKSSVFIGSICVLVNLDQFSGDVLVKKIKDRPRDLVRCSTRDQMMVQIEEIYNFKRQEKINLAFLASEFLRSRNPKSSKKTVA